MKRSARVAVQWMGTVTCCAGLPVAAMAQQPDPLTDFTVQGHVYEPQAVSPTDARLAALSLPQGFHIARFAEGLNNPRMIVVSDNGTVYVTQRTPGQLVMLKDLDRDGVVDVQKVILNLKNIHGLALRGSQMYLTDVTRIYVANVRSDGTIDTPSVVTSNLPDGGQHPNRTLAFSPDGALFISVGSTCNACIEPNPENATLLQVDTSSGKREIFASGLRNTIGFGWHPGSGRLYGMDQGIDWLGDNHQKEELNEIDRKVRYGWPYIYEDSRLNPQDEPLKVTQPEWAKRSREPIGLYDAHAAAMQLVFYTGNAFPSEYRNDAFVSMHGSWNRKPASGYEVVRVRFTPTGDFESFEPFVTDFLVTQPERSPPFPGAQPLPRDGFLGRPAGIAQTPDGALLVGDDTNNAIYRVRYGAAANKNSPQKLAREIVKPRTPAALQVRSSAFQQGGNIPPEFSDYDQRTSPPLSWSRPPAGTKSLVLMMEDPDATSPLPFVHWLAVIDPSTSALPAGVPPQENPSGPVAHQGSNSQTLAGYFGPRPPAGDGPHHYHFQLFAVDKDLSLPSGYNRHALLAAIDGHVLAQGDLVGRFAKAPPSPPEPR